MIITETRLKGCFLIEPQVFKDSRGLFFEVFRKKDLEDKLGYRIDFVQENQSISKKSVLRGLHFQKGNASQSKLVNVSKGKVLDVIVDLRIESVTFGKHLKVLLSDLNRKSIFIPKGMAHGFLALSDNVIFTYKCDNYYHPHMESGIIYNDPSLSIDWGIAESEMIVSEKDLSLLKFDELHK